MFANASINRLSIRLFLVLIDISLALVGQECLLEYHKHVYLLDCECLLNALLGSSLSNVRTVPTIPLFAVLEDGELLRRIMLYASLGICNGVTCMCA
jgi:hypothetical protein